MEDVKFLDDLGNKLQVWVQDIQVLVLMNDAKDNFTDKIEVEFFGKGFLCYFERQIRDVDFICNMFDSVNPVEFLRQALEDNNIKTLVINGEMVVGHRW